MDKRYFVCAKIDSRWYAIMNIALPLRRARIIFQDTLLSGSFAGYKMELRVKAKFDPAKIQEFCSKVRESHPF